MAKKLRIMDWLVHGGHQYEFFKTGHHFFCTGLGGRPPDPKELGRPKNKNVKYIYEKSAAQKTFNIIMVRAGLNPARYRHFRARANTPGVAVMQTYLPYKIPTWTKSVVWNSKVVMDKYRKDFPKQKHFYIPHGFDPREFDFLNLNRNQRVLSAASLFKKRKKVLGFDEWVWVSEKLGKCDLLGHGNDSRKESIGCYPLPKLARTYNKYSVFLNTTTRSAMPRTRAEALMCGTPIVTTKNFGIDRYLEDNKTCLFADTKEDMLKSVKKILESKQMQKDLGCAGRETAVKYFHIDEYLNKWDQVFEETLR